MPLPSTLVVFPPTHKPQDQDLAGAEGTGFSLSRISKSALIPMIKAFRNNHPPPRFHTQISKGQYKTKSIKKKKKESVGTRYKQRMRRV